MDNQQEGGHNSKNEEVKHNVKEQSLDKKNRKNEIKESQSKLNYVSTLKEQSKNKYETAKFQQEYISKNMEKYKQIFDSNFLNEGDSDTARQQNPQALQNGSNNIPAFPENKYASQAQSGQKNNGKRPKFQYNSQGNLSPTRKNEISVIQPANNYHQSQIQITSNNDLSTTFIPKNIFEDIFTQTNTNNNNNNQSTNLVSTKNKKVSSSKLEPIEQQSFHRENDLSNEQLRIKSKNASTLLSQQKQVHLGNIKLNSDISYFKEQKDSKLKTHIDSSTITNTYIMKNPVSLFNSSSDQKKQNMYSLMFEHTSNKEKFDTNIASIKNKVTSDEIRKSQSTHNIVSQNISTILSQSGAKTLEISKKPSQQNLTQYPANLSLNNIDQKYLVFKRSSADMYSHRQLQPMNQNQSVLNNPSINHSQLQSRPNKEILFSKPTNRNEVIELESWLTEMIDKVELTDQMNMKEVYDQIQVIYVACMKELIRQITIQCKDRGKLLEKVWDSYLDLLSKGMQQTQNLKSGEEKEHLDEVTRIHKMYDQSIKLVEKQLEKKKKEQKDKVKQQEQLTDAVHYFRKKLKTYEIEIKRMQQIEDELRFELEAALSENLKLKLIQGDNKQHEDNHLNSAKNSQGSLLNTGQEQLAPPNHDFQIIKSINHITIENNSQKKGSMTTIKIGEKRNKVSVVSHLINFNKRGIIDEEEDENKKNMFLNQFKLQMQDKDNMSEDSEVFGEKVEGQNAQTQRDDEIDFMIQQEKKFEGIGMQELDVFDIIETGVQTEEIRYSDNEQINFLISKLANNDIVAEGEPNLIKQYQESYQIVRSSGLDISQKETILAALDQCKIQVSAYQNLAIMSGTLSKENTELKSKALDLGIQLKEVEQNYIDKKRKWKKKALTYIDKIRDKEEIIQQLESNQDQLEKNLIKNFKQKQLIQAFMGKILKKSPTEELQQDQDVINVINNENENESKTDNENITDQHIHTDESDDKLENFNYLMDSVESDKQTNHKQLLRVISQYVGDGINKENVVAQSKQDLNKILFQLGGKGVPRQSVDSPLNRSKRIKGQLVESKRNNSQCKQIECEIVAKQTKRIYSQNTMAATNIVDNILKKKNSIKNAVVPLSSIMKFFTHIYQEILKNDQGHRIPLYVSCFDILIQKHGLKSVVEDKLARIYKSVYVFKNNNIKLDMIATFIGLNSKYDEIDYYYFLLGLKYFQNINQNILNLSSENGLIQTDKAIEFINNHFFDKLEKEGFNKLVTDIKMSSSQKGIEYEMLLKKCLFYYQEKKEKTKKHIEDIFYATDLDGNDQIELYEFDLIYRYIEKKDYNPDQVEELFFEEADNINISNGEKALSINKFVNLAVQKNLFSQEKCMQFTVSNLENGVAKNFDELRLNFNEYKRNIKNRFLKAEKFMSEIKQIIKALFKQISDPSPLRPNSLWVSYLLMEQESRKFLLDFEATSLLQNMLPLKLQMLNIVAKKFEEII